MNLECALLVILESKPQQKAVFNQRINLGWLLEGCALNGLPICSGCALRRSAPNCNMFGNRCVLQQPSGWREGS